MVVKKGIWFRKARMDLEFATKSIFFRKRIFAYRSQMALASGERSFKQITEILTEGTCPCIALSV